MHNNIKILDCTLRDGGYVNNWEFKKNNIVKIIKNLVNSKINYIECGFYKPIEYQINKSIFSKFSQLEELYENLKDTKLTLMINFGEYSIENIETCKNKKIMLRIAFKKSQLNEAIKYCEQLKEKEYDIFINPMHINTYSSQELLDLILQVNKVQPYGFTIVDTTGAMKEKDILSSFYLIDNNLSNDIALCFHSHNNLQLSFSNAQCLMKICQNRELIIDSTVFGMGRGAGNLCTELITQYINDNYNGNYDLIPILKIVDEQINSIFAQTPWGYSVPYYLAATNHCHPNYAKYLVDKQTVPVEVINELLKTIPNNKKSNYDIDLIKQIYLDNFSNNIDDTATVEKISKLLKDKNILVLAPGKSLNIEKEKIDQYISKFNPFVISLNIYPKQFDVDLTFISNLKRFSSLENIPSKLVVTSNIKNIGSESMMLNYSNYLNDSKLYDNVALMLFNLLIKIGVKNIAIAGLDGFSKVVTENYLSDDLINNAKESEFDEHNQIMSEELQKLSNDIKLNFITTTKYVL